jgi:hypothetical protein
MNWRRIAGSFSPNVTIPAAALLGTIIIAGAPWAFVWLIRALS